VWKGKRKMPICVKSEIGKLKKVMLHRPGEELESLIPGELERLLFDDIPYLKAARQEHDTFAHMLRNHGVEVVYLEDLMAETLNAVPEIRTKFIDELVVDAGITACYEANRVKEYLLEIEDNKALVCKTISGVCLDDLKLKRGASLADQLRNRVPFVMDPIPNLYFTRDPFAAIGNGVSINHMYSATRNRETIYGKYIMTYHPEYGGKVTIYYDRNERFSVEGGDILNLSRKVLMIGVSQRTTPEAIEVLAKQIFADTNSQIETILAIDIPNVRAYMHLDTVLTQVDYDKFVVYPGIVDHLRIFEIKKGSRPDELLISEQSKGLAEVLADRLELEKVTLIHCGGRNRIAAEREQWNDGSNTLCIEPGKVVVYDRNNITNQLLREEGIQILEIPSSELSRGRGGPRCMSMPFVREEIL